MDFNAKLIGKMELLLPKLVGEGSTTTGYYYEHSDFSARSVTQRRNLETSSVMPTRWIPSVQKGWGRQPGLA